MNEQCLGIDWGSKRIGLALGNSATKLASPLQAVGSLEEVLAVVRKEGIERVVIGIPYNEQNPLQSQFQAFFEALTAQVGVPVAQVDERFSSQLADQLGGRDRRDGQRDAVAAMVILQTYFDSLK